MNIPMREKLKRLSDNAMGERIIASPTLSRDSLILRGEKHLFCIAAEK